MPNTAVFRPPFIKRGQPIWIPPSRHLGSFTGSGGVMVGGGVATSFTHGSQVASNFVVEWDFDNDGDFSAGVEDITTYVLAIETTTGRDWPSLLTGKAGPGKLRATLNNDDDRFSYFNTSSPLATAPFSLKTGRKLRVRTTTASNPDPVLLAKDRFGRADGALGTPEVGAAWSGPLANDFAIVSKTARPATEGQAHIALIDVADTDYYAQARLSEVGGATNVVGLVYRYQDTTNYSLAVLDVAAAQLKLIDVVAGTPTTIQSEAVEVYDDVTVGVLVSGASVTFYHEGVPVFSGTAIQTDETEVGIYASWGTGDIRPEVDDFYVWDGLPTQVEGILWTGDVSDLVVSVAAGPKKTAVLEGQGWLSRLASQRLTPMRATQGKRTGILVGNVLGRTNLLHPPGSIDEGDVTTGPVGLRNMDAIEAARRFEETEFGFLRESQEGPLAYDSRSARDVSSTTALFSDLSTDQYHYETIEPLDWRREVINRVFAGVAPSAPSGVTVATFSGQDADAVLTMPATVREGDLEILNIAVSTFDPEAARKWVVPPGWVQVAGPLDDDLSFEGESLTAGIHRILARVADHDSSVGDTFTFTDGLVVSDSYVAQVYVISDWYGSIQNGLAVSDYTFPSSFDQPGDDPPAVFPSWGPAPSLFIAWSVALAISANLTSGYPVGYTNGTRTDSPPGAPFPVSLLTARRLGAVEVENPGAFGSVWDEGGWLQQSVVVAIRGANGGLSSGVVQVQLDDLDSQDDHNSIRTHTEPAELFADTIDATTYAQLVLDTYADDRPLFRISFSATKSGNYRYQAYKRRVGDRITLVAENNAGLGVSGDFYIESIGHRWSNGNTLWETIWELSPV